MAFNFEKNHIFGKDHPQNYRRFLRLIIKLLPAVAVVFTFASCYSYYDTGFFVYTGLGYNHEKIKPDPEIENNGMNYLAGLGYDFGPVSANLTLDIMAFTIAEYHGLGYTFSKIKDTGNLGAGVNVGIKLFESDFFELSLPVGVLFRISNLSLAHDYSAFSQDYKDYDITFRYFYLNAETGLIPAFQFSENWFLIVPFYIGYPVYKYVDVTNYEKKEYGVFSCSVGICTKFLFSGN